MNCRWVLALLVACGGTTKHSTTPLEEVGIAVVPSVAAQTWYRSAAICGQGPYEIEVPVTGVKWGEELALSISTPRRVSITAVVLGDDEEVAKTTALIDENGRGHGKAENLRCIADATQRIAAVRDGGGGGGGGGGGSIGPDVPVGTTIITPPSTPVPLVVETREPPSSTEVVRFGWRERHDGRRVSRLRIRFWSIEPNDLEHVLFGVTKLEWRPNVPEPEYEAYLERQRRRVIAQQETRVESRTRWVRNVADDERREAKLREQQRKRAIEDERRRERAQIDAALEVERRRRREAYCLAHPESRDCWGAGGKRRWAELEQRVREREQYCAAHTTDVRCWSADERARRARAWYARVEVATTPKQPDGPPPAPRDETPPPKLSDNAEWRPGYWQWTGTTWVWLSGMWRVPEEDITLERTTTAPVAPPPPRSEDIPPPPMRTTIWVTGFWQWNGSMYIWVPGSYQARPEVGTSWRPAEWRARGTVHVLIPGGWVRMRGGRR